MKFKNVKKNDEVYSLIYGDGIVENVLAKDVRIEGFYIFSVSFGKKLVHYTEAGVPNWCNSDCDTPTLFYKDEVDFNRVDFKPCDTDLSTKKIKKMIGTGKLEMRCPSGLWRNIDDCPITVVNKGLKEAKNYLFRIVEYVGKERRTR